MPAGNKRSTALGGVLFLALLIYANTLLNGFVYDDHAQVERNPYVHSFKYVGRMFAGTVWSFQGLEGQTNYYRPLMTLAFLICNKAFQSFPAGFHVVNVLLNCIVVWLLFLFCSRLFQDDIVGLAAAAIFAMHPIHTEVVNWIAAMTELELTIFYLASFILFLRMGELPPKKIGTGPWMCACFVLALLSKEQGVTLVLIATIYEHFYRADRDATIWKTKLYRYGGLWIAAALYLVFRITVLGGLAPVRQHADVTGPQAFLSAFALVGQYVAKLFWPHPLLAFYVFQKSIALNDPRVLAGITMSALGLALFIYLWRRARIFSFALIWIAVTLAPVLNAQWMATNVFTERYLYLPSVGFCALLAGALVYLFRRVAGRVAIFRWTLTGVVTLFLCLATGEIVARNRDWHDDFVLLTRTLAVEPHASYMRSDLGVLEWNSHQKEEAEREWRIALIDKPDNAVALSNLGLAMLEKQRFEVAKKYLREVIALKPRFAAPHIHLGRVYLGQKQTSLAELEFRRAVEIYPLSVEARNALGRFYFDQGKLPEAEEQFLHSLEALPNAEAWNRLGDIREREGRHAHAEESWRKVLDLDPYDAHAHLSLGNLYLASHRHAEATKEYRAVLDLDPKNQDARNALLTLNQQEGGSVHPSKAISPKAERPQ